MSTHASAAAPAAKSRRTRARASDKAAESLVSDLSRFELLGEAITWRAARNSRPSLDQLRQALTLAGHDAKYAKDFKPETAFGRAAQKLSDERLINEVGRTDDELIFQFTKTALKKVTAKEGEMEFAKETKLILNRATGKVTCPMPELERMAQSELDRAMSERSTSDITNIVQRLFDDYAAAHPTGTLIPIRDQGGAYLVLADHLPFVGRVQQFLTALGGKMRRLPVPKGTANGDAAAAESIEEMFDGLIGDHGKAVEHFGTSTKDSTLEEEARRIQDTRIRIEAFAGFLGDTRERLMSTLDASNVRLTERVKEITAAKKAMPQEGLSQGTRIDHYYDDGAPHSFQDAAKSVGLPEARVKDHCRFCVKKGLRGYKDLGDGIYIRANGDGEAF